MFCNEFKENLNKIIDGEWIENKTSYVNEKELGQISIVDLRIKRKSSDVLTIDGLDENVENLEEKVDE